MAEDIFSQDFVTGPYPSPAGPVAHVSAQLSFADRLDGCKARWGINRMHYAVTPGVYALGAPGEDSPVLVSANYKLSFDALRRSLDQEDAWILALDTNGINVWCAAGKGTMGTNNLIETLANSPLAQLVKHRSLILPQLAAPGVAAHTVKKYSGWKVVYGPVRAADLHAFLRAGQKAAPKMRRKDFPFYDRLVLAPMELVPALKYGLPLALVFLLLGGLGEESYWEGVRTWGLWAAGIWLWALAGGTLLGPVLLPWLPGRAFAAKGLVLGVLLAVLALMARASQLAGLSGNVELLAWLALIPAFSSFLLMNFTGASTYTSLSGVKVEMRRYVPLQAGLALLGLGLFITSLLLA